MFKNLILILIFTSSLLSYELNFNKKFSQKIAPDILKSYLSITIQNNDEKYINNHIEEFNDYLKYNDNIIKQNGVYNLNPKYTYTNKKQIFDGYTGVLRYDILTNNATNMNEFVLEILELKDKMNSSNIKLNISNTSWIVSKELYDKSTDELRILAINWISIYSKNLNKQCVIKAININNNSTYGRRNEVYSMSKSLANITPMQTQKEISIKPNYILECR